MLRPTPRPVLLLDGGGCTLLGAAVLLGVGALTGPAGLEATWPLSLLGAVLVLYGLDNLVVARRPTRGALRVLAAIDVGFALAAATLVVADPTGAAGWVRGGLLAVALVSLSMGGAKLLATATLHPRRAPVPATR